MSGERARSCRARILYRARLVSHTKMLKVLSRLTRVSWIEAPQYVCLDSLVLAREEHADVATSSCTRSCVVFFLSTEFVIRYKIKHFISCS